METNSLTCIVAYINIESKIKTNVFLSDSLTPRCVLQGCLLSMLLYNIASAALANPINTDKRIKRIQISGREIKIVNFTDNATIFFRDITCINRIQVILRLYLKDNFFKKPSLYGMVHIKIEFIN